MKAKLQQRIGIGVTFALAIILISVYLRNFGQYIQKMEQIRGTEKLANLAVQGATIVGNKIEGVTYILTNLSQTLQTHSEWQDNETMEFLKKQFSRMM